MKWSICLLAGLGLLAGEVLAGDMAYVIKVTPSLVYLDVGQAAGVRDGDVYLVLREKEAGYATVGEARVIRLDAEFSIAEIAYLVAGEEMAVLQRAISMEEWQAMAEPAQLPAVERPPRPGPALSRRRAVYLIGGREWNRETGLRWHHNGIMRRPEKVDGAGLGLRLSSAVSRRWRLNLTYRAGLVGDVMPVGIEGDLHFAPRGCNRWGVYLGAGAGLQHLTWEARAQDIDSTNKFGLNLMGGLQFPGRLGLLVEVGYQRVLQWDDLIDVSNLRTFAGLGRDF